MTPLESRKLEIRELLEARNLATGGEWIFNVGYIESDDSEYYVVEGPDAIHNKFDGEFICLAANKSALLAQHLLIALEALEWIRDNDKDENHFGSFHLEAQEALDKIVVDK